MSDPNPEATALHNKIREYDRRLTDFANARNHPFWTDTGWPALIGDVGRFDVDGQAVELQIVAIDKTIVWADNLATGDQYELEYSDLTTFVRRDQLRKEDQ